MARGGDQGERSGCQFFTDARDYVDGPCFPVSASGASLSRMDGQRSYPDLVATYSIVARDPASGRLGVAVQSHYFSVGSVVTWAEAGVGAVATQSFVDPSYGKVGLDLMRVGRSASDTLKGLLAADENREVRQVAMVDARGGVAAFTGSKCIPMAGHIVGSAYSVQANLMLS